MKYSYQRQLILDDINKRYDHPTAEMIYNEVSKILPNISLGTVYRNLLKLEENNDIDKLYFDNTVHYDAKRKEHQHMRCIKCGEIFDINIIDIENILNNINKNTPHEIISNKFCLSGICEKCNN